MPKQKPSNNITVAYLSQLLAALYKNIRGFRGSRFPLETENVSHSITYTRGIIVSNW